MRLVRDPDGVPLPPTFSFCNGVSFSPPDLSDSLSISSALRFRLIAAADGEPLLIAALSFADSSGDGSESPEWTLGVRFPAISGGLAASSSRGTEASLSSCVKVSASESLRSWETPESESPVNWLCTLVGVAGVASGKMGGEEGKTVSHDNGRGLELLVSGPSDEPAEDDQVMSSAILHEGGEG